MSQPYKVVITDLIVEPLDIEREVLGDIAEVIALGAMQESQLEGQIEDADAVMVYHYFRFTRSSIERLRNCKVIVRPGVGYDGIDIQAAGEHGIPVCNVPDYGTEEVADSAMAMAMSLSRGTHFLNSRLRRGVGDWNVEQAVPIPRLRGRQFGIIGCGRIGTATALRAKAFGFDVAFYDPYIPDGIDKALGIRRDPQHPAHDRLLLNPHTAYYCDEGCAEFRRKGALETRRALLGQPLRNQVNSCSDCSETVPVGSG